MAGVGGVGQVTRRWARSRSARAAAAAGALAVVLAGCAHAPEPQPQPQAQPPASPAPGGPNQLTIWLTGYSWQDNTPPGSSTVGEPVLHQQAGGQGTFADPITVAVPGHQGAMAWQPGTKFYLPSVQRYVIVEDSGAAKQPAGTDTHLDMWIDGQDGTKQATDDCENTFTGRVPAQANPPDNLPVMAGPIFANQKCNVPPQAADMGTYNASDDSGSGDNSGDNSGGDSGDDSGSHHSHHDGDN
ncbi:MAG TPA: hypothetical protein VH008_20950 [Pseudonocardia sp.]|jgi:hypothetical protein|nr:hypothetical protein [Pseudonocardia sp.]